MLLIFRPHFEGAWHQWKGMVRKKWGALTRSEADEVRGRRDLLVGKLQLHYGYSRERAEKEVDSFMHDCEAAGPRCSGGGE